MTSLIAKLTAALTASLIVVLAPAYAGAKTAQKLPAAAGIFTEAPDSIVPLLTRNTRLDMLDYFHSNIDRASSNIYDGSSQVVAEDSCQITIDMSEASDLQIARLVGKADDVIMVIETVATPARDSQVRFFNADWSPLKQSPLTVSIDMWLGDADTDTRETILRELPFMLASAKYTSDDQCLTLTNNLADYYADSYRPQWFDSLKQSLVFRFDGKRFNLIP
jgi:hypothetical protein